MTFIFVGDKRCKLARIDSNFHEWLEQRTIRQPKELRRLQKFSNEPLFSSFEEGSRYVFNKYLESVSLTKEYKQARRRK
jgi:hypothetical protein